ncbi:MAG: transposase, partial [Deltaproteobacteria bacterium]
MSKSTSVARCPCTGGGCPITGVRITSRAADREACASAKRPSHQIADASGIADGRTGSITAVQRFGSDLALNVHFHSLYVDGVYDALGAFTPIEAPTRDGLETLCTTIAE